MSAIRELRVPDGEVRIALSVEDHPSLYRLSDNGKGDGWTPVTCDEYFNDGIAADLDAVISAARTIAALEAELAAAREEIAGCHAAGEIISDNLATARRALLQYHDNNDIGELQTWVWDQIALARAAQGEEG